MLNHRFFQTKRLWTYFGLAISSWLLSACSSLPAIIPSGFSSLLPSINFNSISSSNPNLISCHEGSWFSSNYCQIPVARFISLNIAYLNISKTNILLYYTQRNHQFVFDVLAEESSLLRLNQAFINNYPRSVALMPDALQKLLVDLKEQYIPHKKLEKTHQAYIYLYTLSAIELASTPCQTESINREFILYKAFSMQYTNAILYHIAHKLTQKYQNENELYQAIYTQILQINPYQLEDMAQDLFAKTNAYMPLKLDVSFYTTEGLEFGALGSFSCTKTSSQWLRYGYPFFGTFVSGIPFYVKFKIPDTFNAYDDSINPVIFNSKES